MFSVVFAHIFWLIFLKEEIIIKISSKKYEVPLLKWNKAVILEYGFYLFSLPKSKYMHLYYKGEIQISFEEGLIWGLALSFLV